MDSITLNSYAKLNYTLDVFSRRPDGYHNLASVMQTISLADTILLTRRDKPGITLECDDPTIPVDETNLAWRAAAAALGEARHSAGVHIRIEKRIPSQAGLGGGSSNAAYSLVGVNRLVDLRLSPATLGRMAAELGSDVPFFLAGGTAVARGRGETVQLLPDGPPLWFVVIKPPVGVSTADAYGRLDAIRDRQPARATRRMEEAIAAGDADRVIARLSNDFEEAIVPSEPPIAVAYDDLLMARARAAHLCGSGAAVFGVCLNEAVARETARLARLKHPNAVLCRTVPRSEALAGLTNI